MGAYERRYQRRWGKEPPNRSLPRVALIHDAPADDGENPLRNILGSGGAAVEEWRSGGEPIRIETPFRALVVSAAEIGGESELDHFRRFLRRAIGRSTLIAGLGPGVLLLAREGFLGGRRASGAPDHKEFLAAHNVHWADASVVRDGPFLTCRDPESASDLADELMEMIRTAGEEG